MQRYFLPPSLLSALLLALGPAHAATLTTPSFVVEVHENCEEGNVGCDDVSYTGTSKKTGNRLKLRGKSLYSLCKDGVTPCRFLGYEFRNGATYYRVQEDGNLYIRQGKKVLVDETGTWD